MKPKLNCLHCSGEKIVENVKVIDRGNGDAKHSLCLETYDYPDQWIFKGVHRAEASANVCEDCGFVMMFARVEDVSKLKLGSN